MMGANLKAGNIKEVQSLWVKSTFTSILAEMQSNRNKSSSQPKLIDTSIPSYIFYYFQKQTQNSLKKRKESVFPYKQPMYLYINYTINYGCG